MALFLITCVFDEGIFKENFRVVEAISRESVAEHILTNYQSFADFLENSVFYLWLYDKEVGPKKIWDEMNRIILNAEDEEKLVRLFRKWFLDLSPERVLKWIDRTNVECDSRAQMAINEIKEITKIS